jgi:hypothetical protein
MANLTPMVIIYSFNKLKLIHYIELDTSVKSMMPSYLIITISKLLSKKYASIMIIKADSNTLPKY